MSRISTYLFLGAVALFLLLPLIVVFGVSLNEKQSLTFPPEGFSLAWYAQIFTDPEWRSALFNSLILATGSAFLSISIALPLSWFLWRWYAPWANIFRLLGIAPFILPPVITALGFLTFWATSGFYGEPWTAIVSHGIFFVTLPLVTTTLGFTSIDKSVVEVSSTLGASEFTAFKTVVFPLIQPYIISGFAFTFVLSLNEYIVAYMSVGFTMETLPIKIFNALRYGYTPTMAAVSFLFVGIAALIFAAVARFGDLPKLLGNHSGGDVK